MRCESIGRRGGDSFPFPRPPPPAPLASTGGKALEDHAGRQRRWESVGSREQWARELKRKNLWGITGVMIGERFGEKTKLVGTRSDEHCGQGRKRGKGRGCCVASHETWKEKRSPPREERLQGRKSTTAPSWPGSRVLGENESRCRLGLNGRVSNRFAKGEEGDEEKGGHSRLGTTTHFHRLRPSFHIPFFVSCGCAAGDR